MKQNLPKLEESSPLIQFFKQDSVAAFLLFISAMAALIMANSSAHSFYQALWSTELSFHVGEWRFAISLHHLVNDGLMAIFFFLVGLEMKREVLVGELASPKKAILPAMCALGGMLFPAIIFTLFNSGTEAVRGWGIPMATDIAFATGLLALLGKRVPFALTVFLMALAIVDDIGSVLVIAIFYTNQLALFPLIVGMILVVFAFSLNYLGVKHSLPYLIVGIITWILFLQSGVHATIAGFLLALAIPASAHYETPFFSGRMNQLLKNFTEAEDFVNPLLVNAHQQSLIRHILKECYYVEAPIQRIEHYLHPLCVFVIMPIFAFANSGVVIDWSQFGEVLIRPVSLGVFFGLILGKQMGIFSLAYFAVKMRWAELPEGITWKHIYGVSWPAGIGFTMSLFIGELAYSANGVHLVEAKVGIFMASIVAGIGGYLLLRSISKATSL